MKLTKAQLAALQSVNAGTVYQYQPTSIKKPARVVGAHKIVIGKLQELKLVRLPNRPIYEPATDLIYELTDLGRQILEENT